jgi:hypothetical protein
MRQTEVDGKLALGALIILVAIILFVLGFKPIR